MEDNLVVQRPAKQRMRMANHGSVRGILGAGVQQRFQPTSWTLEKERFDGGVLSDHKVQIT